LPSSQPSTFSAADRYWVINNYGFNQGLFNLESLKINNLPAISSPQDYSLYSRDANSGAEISWFDQGQASPESSSGSVLFDAASSPIFFTAQYFVGTDELTNVNTRKEMPLQLYPNPLKGNTIYLKGLKEAARFTLFNLDGKVVVQQYVEAGQQGIEVGDLPAGNYFYSMEGSSHFFRGKLNIQ